MTDEQPNLTQFFGGSGPQPPPDGSEPDPLLDFSLPSPAENPDAHDSCTLQLSSDPTSPLFTLPPTGMGTCTIKVTPAVKIDKKGGAGKKAPRQTKTGGEATKVDITIKCVVEAWPYIVAASRAIQPGSGPWKVGHPKTDLAKVDEIEIAKWKDAPECKDGHCEIVWEFEAQAISPKAQSGAGGGNGTATPDAADAQRKAPGAAQQSQGAPQKSDPNANKTMADAQAKAAQP